MAVIPQAAPLHLKEPERLPMTSKSNARARAQNLFPAAERRDDAMKAEIARERAATDAKTIRLRALRLAKEEADRLAQIAHDAANPPPVRKVRGPK